MEIFDITRLNSLTHSPDHNRQQGPRSDHVVSHGAAQ